MANASELLTPSPTLPARGRVWAGGRGAIVPQTQGDTSPLVGEDGRGVFAATPPATHHPREI